MPKTQKQLLLSLRERLDEEAQSAWKDTELRRWLNEGAKDIARRTEVLQKKATISAVAGTQQYAMSTDIIRVHKVEYTPSGSSQPIYPLTYDDFRNLDAVWWTQQALTSGTPNFYTFWGFPPSLQIIVYPKPSQAGTFNIYYFAMPTELALDGSQEASNLELPEGWEDAVVLYAEYMALRKDLRPEWQEAKALYEQMVNDLYSLTRRWTDQSGYISPDTASFSPFGFGWEY